MATNTFNSIHHHLRRRHSIDHPPRHSPSTAKTTVPFSLKPITATATHAAAAAAATYAASPSTSQEEGAADAAAFDALRRHLSSKNFREADEETRRLLIALAGEAAAKRGYVFFSEVQFIPADDLRAIDALWRQHSGGRFGYSVQKRVWDKAGRDFTRFFIRVGWMKKLQGSEVEHFNYRSFPTEFMWDMEDGTPEGHLPLTNALRGTQLLSSILTHPAFQGEEDTQEEGGGGATGNMNDEKTVKPNYTF